MPKVSIVVSIYNVEDYVKKSIESVINQTEQDIEIILVDDGSTDSSGKICDEFALNDNRIIVIHKENGGLSSARNKGINVATSEFVLLLDGDDYLALNAVEKLLCVSQSYPSDIIQFSYCEVKKDSVNSGTNDHYGIYQAKDANEFFENLYRIGGSAASACTKFFKRELLLKFPFESIRHEDEMWCTRAFQSELVITYIDDELYFYVMRENSIIHSKFNSNKLDVFTVINERIQALKKTKLNKFLHFEYERMFYSIVKLYCEASGCGDKIAMKIIKEIFHKNKNKIKNNTLLNNKFKVLFNLMSINFNFIVFYVLYFNFLGK